MLRFWSATAPYRRRVKSEYRRTASVVSFNHDGVEIARVKRRSGTHWLPLWHIMVFVYLILLIRLIAMVDIGPAGYAYRMEEMQNGTIFEKAAATVMGLDPISRSMAVKLRAVVNFVEG